MQAEIGNFALELFFDSRLLNFASVFVLKLVQTLLQDPNLLEFLVNLKHIIKLFMSFVHFENDSAPLNGIKAICASDEQLHDGLFEIILVHVVAIDAHDVLICLHLP